MTPLLGVIIFFVMMTGSIFVEASSSGIESNKQTKEDVLRLFYWQAPTVFNPYLATGNKDREICRIVYEPLASHDRDGNLIPILAESIPTLQNGGVSKDGRWVVWKLKSGVTWSDGHPFTAKDVLFTWRFINDPATGANGRSVYNAVESVEIVDALTVKITFGKVYSSWDLPFVGKQGMILPAHVFEQVQGRDIRQYIHRLAKVGTGPYCMASLSVKETLLIGDDVINIITIVFDPNPHYREKEKPFFNRLELHGGGDSLMAAKAVLKQGTADYAWNLQTAAGHFKAHDVRNGGRFIYEEGSGTEKIVLNFLDPEKPNDLKRPHPFFHDKRVRQAVAHAVDRQAIAALYSGDFEPVTDLIVLPERYRSPETAAIYPYDLKRSAELLDEAGWIDSDGDGIRDKEGKVLRIRFQTSVNRVRQKTQHLVKKALESIGIEVFLNMIDASVFFGKSEDPNHFIQFRADMEAYSSGNPTPCPAPFLIRWLCDRNAAGMASSPVENFTGYCNPGFDALYGELMNEATPKRRQALIVQMNALLIEDVALIPLVRRIRVHAASSTLENIDITPWDWSTWNIGAWKRKE